MNLPLVFLLSASLLGGSTAGRASQAPPRDDARSYVSTQLGIELSVTESRLRRNIISTRTPYGFLIARVQPGSPAARAGLHAGDVLLEWGGSPLREVEELADHARRLRAGGEALRYSRKLPNARDSFPATDPWETRRTRIRPARAAIPPRRPI